MTTLHLGVLDTHEPNGAETHFVAEILEAEYGLFSKFAEYNEQRIAEQLADSVQGAIETLLMGGTVTDPFAEGCEEINQDFRRFLDEEKIAALGVPGVPTKAALSGRSKRFKRSRGPRRPSFIDSGTLQASFKSWVSK